MTTAAVVLAAGGGTRFAGPSHKLLTMFRDQPLGKWAIDAAADADLDELIVVVGAVDLADLIPTDATVVLNERWTEGQASSLQAAISAARTGGHGALVVGLADQPMVPAAAWREVAASAAPIAVATYAGELRNPVRLARSVWPLVPAAGDEGARSLVRGRPDLVELVSCGGHPADVDTEEDLRRWS